MAHDRPSQNDYDVYESILSFNYTRPVEAFGSSEHDADFINIHGRLGGEIVFDIDGTGRMGNSEILSFTKTYRLMAMDLPNMGSVDKARKDMMTKAIALLTAYGGNAR